MKTKNLILFIMKLTVFMIAAFPAAGQNKIVSDSSIHDTIIYTCPMHPEIQFNQPGTCPKCGMALVQKKTSSEHNMDMMMCSEHGMTHRNHKHDEQQSNNLKMMKRMGIGMGIMMIGMLIYILSR